MVLLCCVIELVGECGESFGAVGGGRAVVGRSGCRRSNGPFLRCTLRLGGLRNGVAVA